MKNLEIYTDKENKKAIIIADEELLSSLKAACIAYCVQWKENRIKAEEAEDEREIEICRKLSDKYSDMYSILSEVAKSISSEEE